MTWEFTECGFFKQKVGKYKFPNKKKKVGEMLDLQQTSLIKLI